MTDAIKIPEDSVVDFVMTTRERTTEFADMFNIEPKVLVNGMLIITIALPAIPILILGIKSSAYLVLVALVSMVVAFFLVSSLGRLKGTISNDHIEIIENMKKVYTDKDSIIDDVKACSKISDVQIEKSRTFTGRVFSNAMVFLVFLMTFATVYAESVVYLIIYSVLLCLLLLEVMRTQQQYQKAIILMKLTLLMLTSLQKKTKLI